MTESGWSDYLSDAGSSDLAAELSQAADLDDAASTGLAVVSGELVDPDAADAASDAAIDLSAASTALESGVDNTDWADWHGDIAADAATSGQSYLDAAAQAAAGGWDELAQYNLDNAAVQFDYAGSQSETAADYASSAGADVTEAVGYETSAAADVSAYDASSSYDTSSYDETGYDTGSTE